ncbi:extracellular solute-binding protein, partial [Streptomyces sp. WAC06614]
MPKTDAGQEAAFVASGTILPVSDYIDLMPNYKKTIEDWKFKDEFNSILQQDGRYYLLPGMHEQVWPEYTLTVRLDVFEQDGIAIPTTWDELRSALRQLKAKHAGVYPLSDKYQANSILQNAGLAYGTVAGWGFGGAKYDAAADAFVYPPMTKQYRDLVEYFNGLVAEGLMDPESFTHANEQADQKFVTGKTYVITSNSQDLPTWRRSMDDILGRGK